MLHLRTEGSTLDSPAQNAKRIPAELATNDRCATVAIASIGAVFEGTLSGDRAILEGPFRQGGVELKATFHRRQIAAAAAPVRERPQMLKLPFAYAATDVIVPDGDVTLVGTLTIPKGKGPFPAVVMIGGSGPQDRDETVAGHRIFLVIVNRLTREGIAVLRYDKRGVGRSPGSFATATQRDFTADATAALDWLRRQSGIDAARVGLLGHSEGAEIAPAVANADGRVAFAILLSAPAETGAETIASQAKAIALANGVPPAAAAANDALQRRLLAAVAGAPDGPTAKRAAMNILVEAGLTADRASAQAAALSSPWYRAFLVDDPLPRLEKLKIPTLVVAGGRDLQVLPERNLPPIRQALAGNPNAKVVELPGLNHLLQPASTGSPSEYDGIATTVDPGALDLIAGWARSTTRS